MQNEKGFSLIEVLVGVVAMSVVGLGFASLMNFMTKNQRGIKDTSEVQSAVNEMQMLLNNTSKSCKSSISPTPTKTFPFALQEIKWPTGQTVIKLNTDLKNAKGLQVTSIQLTNAALQPTTSSQMIAGVTHTYDIYRADIVVNFKKTIAGTSTGPTVFTRTLPISLLYDQAGGAFFDCYLEDSHDSQCADYFSGNYVGATPPKCHVPIAVSDSNYSINTGGSATSTGTTRLFVSNGGAVGINTTNPGAALDVAGDTKANNITANQTITASIGSIGGCTLSGGSLSCPNSITTSNPAIPGCSGTLTCPAGQVMTGLSGCTPICTTVAALTGSTTGTTGSTGATGSSGTSGFYQCPNVPNATWTYQDNGYVGIVIDQTGPLVTHTTTCHGGSTEVPGPSQPCTGQVSATSSCTTSATGGSYPNFSTRYCSINCPAI